MINSLQAGRFLAAFAVVLHHSVISVMALVDGPAQWVQPVISKIEKDRQTITISGVASKHTS